ncbi:MAG: hypothetical protein H7Y04_12545 [Verrucomicrobia bacterium]|nr:hypothetical protein [Cytophagales bacterium]
MLGVVVVKKNTNKGATIYMIRKQESYSKMSKNQIAVGFILLTAILYLFFRFFLKKDYGYAYNDERIELGIPIIDKDLALSDDSDVGSQLWCPIENTKDAYHSMKKVKLTMGNIEYEYDYFKLKKGSLGLSIGYVYSDTAHFIVAYHISKNDSIGIKSIPLSYAQGVDTLKKYNLWRND